jgi:hypothetical protein
MGNTEKFTLNTKRKETVESFFALKREYLIDRNFFFEKN